MGEHEECKLYVCFAFVVGALGVVNILIASEAAHLSGGSGDTGGLYGVLEACESIAGMIGPALGGVLARIGDSREMPHLVLGVVVAIYAVNAAAVLVRHWRRLSLSLPAASGEAAGGHTK